VPRISDLVAVAPSTRGKIELTLSEDDGQEDRVIGKLVGEAIKNVFAQYVDVKSLRPLVEWFEGGKSFVVGDKVPSSEYARRINENPPLKKVVADLAKRPENAAIAREAGDALAASLAEFVFEGLHVENRLNKATKGGETSFKR
jgi:magnesium chelatase subunit I